MSVFQCAVPGPRIITHPTDTSAAAPFSAVFTCSVQAFGTISIEWRGKDNLPSPIQVSTPELTTSTLTIPNVTEKDAGTYYCVVWANRQGAISNEAKLIFAGMYNRLIYLFIVKNQLGENDCVKKAIINNLLYKNES